LAVGGLLFFAVIGFKPWAEAGEEKVISIEAVRELPSQPVTSAYFDRAMDYSKSRFRAVSLAELLDRFDLDRTADAALLECFDDYQGIVAVDDIRRFNLLLATEIEIAPGFKRPGWLNPLLILVPDGSDAPFQERFMTANIRQLRLVRLDDYYAPLARAAGGSSAGREGLVLFKDNCLFCHSLEGIGGNKGGPLLQFYDFGRKKERERFHDNFRNTHGADNPDKQNLSQFITDQGLRALTEFLRGFAASPGK